MQGKVVIFDGEESTMHSLNRTASKIFGELKRGKSEEEIADFIAKTYSITKERAAKDVRDLIADLKKKKIIK